VLFAFPSPGVDLVIDIVEHSADRTECGYYFVDQEKRVIFWLDEFPMSQLRVWRRVPGILTHTHARRCFTIGFSHY
jgi:hypothetical protein